MEGRLFSLCCRDCRSVDIDSAHAGDSRKPHASANRGGIPNSAPCQTQVISVQQSVVDCSESGFVYYFPLCKQEHESMWRNWSFEYIYLNLSCLMHLDHVVDVWGCVFCIGCKFHSQVPQPSKQLWLFRQGLLDSSPQEIPQPPLQSCHTQAALYTWLPSVGADKGVLTRTAL